MAISLRDKAKQQRDERIFIIPDTIHPGFPRINPIMMLQFHIKQSTDQEVNMAVRDLRVMSKEYEGSQGAALRKPRNNIMRMSEKSMVGMSAYFSTSELETGIETINKIVREKMELAMLRGSHQGVTQTANVIRHMTRDFKSRYIPTKAVPGDLYHTIADSLKAADRKTSRHGDEFVDIRAGSYDIGDSPDNPTGIRGSRMKPSDPSLTELTSRDVTPFKISRRIAGTKRLKNLLKGRNIAGVKRK
jgi:hypothetical protein